MGRAKLCSNLGPRLRKAREKLELSLAMVVAKLEILGVKCSKSNLSRIEMEETSCRIDIFAGLTKVYELEPKDLLYS